MSDFILDHPLLVIVLGVFILVFGVGGCFYHYEQSTNNPIRMELSYAGYDVPDVEVFLGRIGSNLTEFKSSRGLRKQYELNCSQTESHPTSSNRRGLRSKRRRLKVRQIRRWLYHRLLSL